LVNMFYSFQDKENLFLVMDLMTGGDLRYHMSRKKRFSETETSTLRIVITIEFIVGCVVGALEYIHNNCILHRDVKPENLVFDNTGYLHLTDFGIARIWHSDNAQDTSGTPGYMGTII